LLIKSPFNIKLKKYFLFLFPLLQKNTQIKPPPQYIPKTPNQSVKAAG